MLSASAVRTARASLDQILAQPTCVVAMALLTRTPTIGRVPVDAGTREVIGDQLEAATGRREPALEQLRDQRSFGDFLETSHLVRAQRLTFTHHHPFTYW